MILGLPTELDYLVEFSGPTHFWQEVNWPKAIDLWIQLFWFLGKHPILR